MSRIWNRVRPATALSATVGLVAGLLLTVVGPDPAAAAPGDITTVAGRGIGDGGLAVSARVGNPQGLASDAAGNLYIVDQESNSVRKVSPAGVITRFAGNGMAGFSGDGGPADLAQLTAPYDVDVDPAGNVYIADYANGRIRKVGTDGVITTIAGNGELADYGDEGPATAAALTPQGIAVDGAGNVYFSDQFTYRVRRVDSGGTIHAFAGQRWEFDFDWYGGDEGPAVDAKIFNPMGLATDSAGNVFIADNFNNRVRKVDGAGIIHSVAGTGGPFESQYSGDGGPATEAGFAGPADVDFDSTGALFLSDQFNNRIRRIAPGAEAEITGAAEEIVTTVAGTGVFGDTGGDGGPATDAGVPNPNGIALDGAGNLFLSDAFGHVVRRVDAATQIINRYAGGGEGDGGQATNALVTKPYGVAARSGSVFFSEGQETFGADETLGNRVREIDGSGVVDTVAGNGTTGFAGDGGPATAASLNEPRGVAFDAGGNLFVADCRNNRVRRVSAGDATIATVAGGGAPFDGVGDGGAATAAALGCPSGLEVAMSGPDAGALYIADADGHRVRRVPPGADGVVNGGDGETISTVAGTGTAGYGGDGGAATEAKVNFPSNSLNDSLQNDPGPDLALDAADNLYIADEGNNRVRKIVPGADGVVDGGAGETISTVAGNGSVGYAGNGVQATSVPLNSPQGVLVDGGGNLLVAETHFGRMRKVDAAGTMTTVAGTEFPGYSGDGGPATAAQLSEPTNLALDAGGSLYITDRGNQVIRRVEAGTPGAAPVVKKKACGAVITKSTTLKEDIGPCPGDGIVIGADNITLDLAGHRVSGPANGGGAVGIRIDGRKGVTVKGGATKGPKPGRSALGTVTGFGAGVAVIGGSGNTIQGLSVEDNVGSGQFGDGIAVFFSPGNRITDNVLRGNGIYDGIGILGIGSNDNVVSGNVVEETTALGDRGEGVALGIVLNPFLDATYPRQIVHTGNQVTGNVVSDNEAGGISSLGNTFGSIRMNTVEGNGLVLNFPSGNGIGVQSLLQVSPQTGMLIEANQVHGNARNGIEVHSQGNTIRGNNAADNRVDPSFFGGFDLRDRNVGCDSNVWDANIWGTGGFSPLCTTAGGHQAAPGESVAPTAAPQDAPALLLTRKHPPKPR